MRRCRNPSATSTPSTNCCRRIWRGDRLLLIHIIVSHWFTRSGLDEAKRELDRFGALRGLSVDAGDQALDADVRAALSDDLNTPAVGTSQVARSQYRRGNAKEAASGAKGRESLGLLDGPEEWFRWAPSAQGVLDDAQIESLIQQRAEARAAKALRRIVSRDRLAKPELSLKIA